MVRSHRFLSIVEGFFRSSERFPDRPAVEVAGATLAYGELRKQAASLGATLERHTPDGGPPLTAVFAHRSPTAFAGVLAALWRGYGYVPLNRTFPPTRTRTMLERSGCRSLVVDRESSERHDRSGFCGLGGKRRDTIDASDDDGAGEPGTADRAL